MTDPSEATNETGAAGAGEAPPAQAGQPATTGTPAQAGQPATAGQPAHRGTGQVAVTRTSRTWIGLGVGLVALVLILIFILQNLDSVKVTFFTASGSFPLAVALLFAAILGAATVLLVGSIRIVQLRLQVRRRGRLGQGSHPQPPPRADDATST